MKFTYKRSADQDTERIATHPVVVVGAGPVGLSFAIDLAKKGQKVVLLDNDHKLSTGSRAICFAKRTVEVFDRLGVGQQVADKGVSWNVGKVFFKDRLTYQFDLLPEPGHKHPAFFNIQQYHVEGFLVEQALKEPNIEIRWLNKVLSLFEGGSEPARVKVETPDGPYELYAEYVVACDGSRSTVRRALGKESKGRVFQDRFLIADVTMSVDFPTERWFWFDPPFHPHQSVLLHKQPDGQWRIDFQLGWDADPEEERKPENIRPRIQALLGQEIQFEIVWASVYTFACSRMDEFQAGRVFFAGDAAHGVSPFGARGANSGVQDAENLAWKLDLVMRRLKPASLLKSYLQEREAAADENILNSTRATDFITPKSEISRLFRDATLSLAQDFPFARRLVNSGRLSVASHYRDSSLNQYLDETKFQGGIIPGSPALDGSLQCTAAGLTKTYWLLDLCRDGFVLLYFVGSNGGGATLSTELLVEVSALRNQGWPIKLIKIGLTGGDETHARDKSPPKVTDMGDEPHDYLDHKGYLQQRYQAQEGTLYVLRPDQYVLTRWKQYPGAQLEAMLVALGDANGSGNLMTHGTEWL
jgi:3-(3-hydroxy-phenyl)propionate hydroxylase